jgi:hypothetical protein
MLVGPQNKRCATAFFPVFDQGRSFLARHGARVTACRPVLPVQDLTGQLRPESAFLMRRTNPSHWDEVNLRSVPD